MVRRHSTEGRNTLRILVTRTLQEVFELSNLVAAVQSTCLVVVLDGNLAIAERRSKRQLSHRRWQIGENNLWQIARQLRKCSCQMVTHCSDTIESNGIVGGH